MQPQAIAELLTGNQDFSVTGALGPQGLGKSAFLNRLLGNGLQAAGTDGPQDLDLLSIVEAMQ